MSERAACLQNFPMVIVVVLLIVTFATGLKSTTPGIFLHVSYNDEPKMQSGLLVVNCSVDTKLTDIVTVISLTVLGPKPYGNQGEFDELAVIDIWSKTPKLTSDLEDSKVTIHGKASMEKDSHPYLFMSWNTPTPGSRHEYKCVANGLDRQRQPASINKAKKVEFSRAGCCEKIDSIDSQLREMSEKLETFKKNLNFQIKMMAIDKSRFDVSNVSKNRVYLASKVQAAFKIQAANEACKSSGGYLVEFDDDEEYRFVYDFLHRTGGANTFWTGGNDIEKEGQFVYFNSKKLVPSLTGWSHEQPDNANDNEDCMEIRLNYEGFNDWTCDESGKFVCEVELSR
ncbi:collectin-11 [Plakobranchus ocellatus]|uniref:Collectin-11 n=1 Tax=Plakobranchus ocellatus TaxID=259542 RepID=A0AAV3Y1X0_9GAST|nr:collectin-11 [Plakobranchus ocellatus]